MREIELAEVRGTVQVYFFFSVNCMADGCASKKLSPGLWVTRVSGGMMLLVYTFSMYIHWYLRFDWTLSLRTIESIKRSILQMFTAVKSSWRRLTSWMELPVGVLRVATDAAKIFPVCDWWIDNRHSMVDLAHFCWIIIDRLWIVRQIFRSAS